MNDFEKALNDIELQEVFAIRGTKCITQRIQWDITYRWYSVLDSSKYVERSIGSLYIKDIPDFRNIIKSARVEVLKKFPYVTPDDSLLLLWERNSKTLKNYVTDQDYHNLSVLRSLFSSPAGALLEILLVERGEA